VLTVTIAGNGRGSEQQAEGSGAAWLEAFGKLHLLNKSEAETYLTVYPQRITASPHISTRLGVVIGNNVLASGPFSRVIMSKKKNHAGRTESNSGEVRLGVAITVSCAFFMENFDGTVLATAIPSIAQSLHVSPVSTNVGITAYLVSLAMFIPLSGWLADRFGARNVFATALILFAAASWACAISTSLPFFSVARILQGFGGAMMVPVGRLIVLKTTDRAHLVKAMSIVTTPALLGASLGPPIGGFLSTYASWRMIFLINLPIALIGLLLIHRYIPNLREEPRAFDWKGFFLSVAAVATSMMALQSLTRSDVDLRTTVALLVLGSALLFLTLSHARRRPNGLIDLSLLKHATFASVVSGGGMFFVAVASVPFLVPLLLQVGLHKSAFVSGLVMFASALGGLFVKQMTPLVLRRFGFRSTLSADSLGLAAAMILVALTTGLISIVVTGVIIFVLGLLRSMQFAALNTMVYADVPADRSSRATSLADTLKQLWQAVGVSISAILVRFFAGWMQRPGPAPERAALLVMAAIGILAVFVFRRLPASAGAAMSGHAKHTAPSIEDGN
jgi:EmrB/QacA subfamily drug resistance transporter